MSALHVVRNLITGMSSEEKKVFRNLLTAFDSRGDRFNSKSLKLFDLLSEPANEMSDNEIEFYLYGKQSPGTFSRLLIRLRDKLLESLLLDVNIKREGGYIDLHRYVFEVRKKISYGQIIVEQGQVEFALFIYDNCIEICERYEFYDELVIVMGLKIQALSSTNDPNSINRMLSKYNEYDTIRKGAMMAYSDYIRLIKSDQLVVYSEKTESIIRPILLRMESDIEQCNSNTVLYYYNEIKVKYLQLLNQHVLARKVLIKQLKLVEKSLSLQIPFRLGGILLELARSEFYQHRIEQSIDYCQQARVLLKQHSKEEHECLVLEFCGHFYSEFYSASHEIIKELLKQNTKKTLPESKLQYLLACVLFIQGLYFEAKDLLLELKFGVLNEEWDLHILILIILSEIEILAKVQGEKNYSNLRKYIRRLEHINKPQKRDILISEILVVLFTEKCNFKATHQQLTEQFGLLGSDEKAYRWKIESPELINFQQWFFSHLTNGKYSLKMPKYIDESSAPIY